MNSQGANNTPPSVSLVGYLRSKRRFEFGKTRALVLVLFALSFTYVLFGLSRLGLGSGSSYPIDLRLRWTEGKLIWNGYDPQVTGYPDSQIERTHKGLTKMGGTYQPWAYSIGLALTPPLPWWLTRLYATLINAVALGLIGWWAYQKAQEYSEAWRWVSVGSALAMFPTVICLSYGQYGVIILACLVVTDSLLECRSIRRDLLAGCALGIACIKPHLGGLFVLAVLLEGRFLVVVSWIGFLSLASGITWFLTGLDPATMLRRSVEASSQFAFLSLFSQNPLLNLLRSHVGFHSATAILGISQRCPVS